MESCFCDFQLRQKLISRKIISGRKYLTLPLLVYDNHVKYTKKLKYYFSILLGDFTKYFSRIEKSEIK